MTAHFILTYLTRQLFNSFAAQNTVLMYSAFTIKVSRHCYGSESDGPYPLRGDYCLLGMFSLKGLHLPLSLSIGELPP